MPRGQQRRLDALILKSKGDGLTDPEMRELEQLLDEVDRQSFWMLAKRFVPRPVEAAKKPARRAAG